MAIEKINFTYPKGTLQSVYDVDEMTALELAAKTSKKVDECVELVNGVEQSAIEATAVVDEMRIAQDQFMTENNDIRQQLIVDNQTYLVTMATNAEDFETSLNAAKTAFETQMTADLDTFKADTAADKATYEGGLNTSKTTFETNMTNAVNNIITNSETIIQNDVNQKVDNLVTDGTIESLLNVNALNAVKTELEGDISTLETNTNNSLATKAPISDLTNHKEDIENPHNTTAMAVYATDKNSPLFNRLSTVAVADGGNLSTLYTYVKLNNDKKILSGTPARIGAWIDTPTRVGNDENKPFVDVEMPFGVVVGDSIAAGNPNKYSRLQQSGGIFYVNDYPNEEGQLSYELGRLTGMYWYNHGIGSQTSVDIWNRWSRDILGETYDANDGIGDKTLPRKAYSVFIHVGINDIFLNVPEATIKTNMINMAKSCKDNNIVCVFDNIGEHSLYDTTKRNLCLSLNQWMKETLPKYGAYVCDFYTWSKNPSGSGVRTDGMMADYVHPATYGYQSMAINMYKQLTSTPFNYYGLYLNMVKEAGEAHIDLCYAKNVTIKIIPTVGQTETAETFNANLNDYANESLIRIRPKGFGYKARIIINSVHPHGNSAYVGFSNIDVCMGCPSNNEQKEIVSTDNTFGTFVPTIAGLTVEGNNTYSTQNGYYTIVGNICYFNLYVLTSSKDDALSGNLCIKGLPKTSKNVIQNKACITVGLSYFNHLTTGVSIGGEIHANEDKIRLTLSANDGTAQYLPATALNNISGLSASGFYLIA